MGAGDKWWKDSLVYSSQTDIGMRRTNNQDSRSSFPAATPRLWQSRGHLFVVADGMGAHAAGELASQIAVESIPQCYFKRMDEPPWEAIRQAILETHRKIKQQGHLEEAFRDMGTTVVSLLVLPEAAFVANVGDSRVYRLRQGTIEQITFDHSLVWELKRSGRIHEDKIPKFIPKNVITRSLGPTENLMVDVEGPFPLQSGDTFLLCTDGLSGHLEDTEMGQILQLLPPEEATETLVNLANLRGGADNITLTVVKFLQQPAIDEVRRDRAMEKRPRLSTLPLTFLALAITSFIPIFTIFAPKVEYRGTISLIALVMTLLWGALFVFTARKTLFYSEDFYHSIAQLGAAPYANSSAIAHPTFAESILDIKAQLCDAVKRERIVGQTPKLTEMETELARAKQEKNPGRVIIHCSKIINYLMAEVKKVSAVRSNY